MIHAMNITRTVGRRGARQILLDNVSLRVEPREQVGILAKPGSGKSTLVRILSGLEQPDFGAVTCEGTVSWPIGFSSMFHPSLSPSQNVAHVAGLYNLDALDLVARVEDFSELGASYTRPLRDLSPALRNQLALSLSLCVDFDTYIADDMGAVGTPEFRDKCEAALLDRGASSALVVLSRHAHVIRQYAATVYVLCHAKLIACDSADQAADILKIADTETEGLNVPA